MYQVVYRDVASLEYLDAINWYKERSIQAASRFVDTVNKRINDISSHPRRYKKIYKHYHEVSLKSYPFSIVYFVEDDINTVIVVAIYHHKRHPLK